MIKLIGTIKKVDTKSKVGEDNRTYHNVVLGFEITDGVERIQEIVESLKQLCSISIENVQPVLPITDHETRKLVGDEKPAGTSKKKSK